VLAYWESFGLPAGERKLQNEVQGFVDHVESLMAEPELDAHIPLGGFWSKARSFKVEFVSSFSAIGTADYTLPDKWQDRLARVTPAKTEKLGALSRACSI
jgi:hypothetical protein